MRVEVKNNLNLDQFKEGGDYSKRYKVVEKSDNYMIVARTFKNGKPRASSKKVIFSKS